jgi:hypothetical protein
MTKRNDFVIQKADGPPERYSPEEIFSPTKGTLRSKPFNLNPDAMMQKLKLKL